MREGGGEIGTKYNHFYMYTIIKQEKKTQRKQLFSASTLRKLPCSIYEYKGCVCTHGILPRDRLCHLTIHRAADSSPFLVFMIWVTRGLLGFPKVDLDYQLY